jgi:hypothetical protein
MAVTTYIETEMRERRIKGLIMPVFSVNKDSIHIKEYCLDHLVNHSQIGDEHLVGNISVR